MQYQLYKDARQEWRWRFVTNGRTIADSGEGYKNRADAERGSQITKTSAHAPTMEYNTLASGLLGDFKI
jgi:uncharacterized protein YegP (UPF0339 family)